MSVVVSQVVELVARNQLLKNTLASGLWVEGDAIGGTRCQRRVRSERSSGFEFPEDGAYLDAASPRDLPCVVV